MGIMPTYLIYKPYGMLSQFSRETPEQKTLADLAFDFPKDVYPVGRLDADSEGLLLLSNDKSLNSRLLHPSAAHPRSYWTQVEGAPRVEALERLRRGVEIRIDGKSYRCLPAQARILEHPPTLPDRNPPVRFRKTVPDTWIELTLTEGKNRQVRRMCAAIGHPVLRLVRVKIGNLEIASLLPGAVRVLTEAEVKSLA